MRTWHAWRGSIPALAAVAAVVLAACSAALGAAPPARQPAPQPPCSPNPPPEAPPLHLTTVTTIRQAYYCVFAYNYAAPVAHFSG